MGTTTNNGWTYPESTDLVKDGATAIETLATDIDTTLGVYAPSTSGLELINTTSFSGVSSASINNVFSATYDNYLITISGTFASTETANLRLRVAGVDNSTASSYLRQSVFGDILTGNAGAFRDTGSTSLTAIWNASTNVGVGNIYVYRPFTATTTFFASQRGSELLTAQTTGYHNQSVSYDGFTLIANASNFTATISTYGLAK
jgi:hypothetical protein